MTDYTAAKPAPWGKNLRSVTVSPGVTSIGSQAFTASSLESVSLPEGLVRIGESAFYGCDSLTELTIPASVTSIRTSAFGGCRFLLHAYFLGAAPTVGANIFPAGVTVHYVSGKSGWTFPMWNFYTTSPYIPAQSVIHVTGVTLDRTEASLRVGDTLTLHASVAPTTASDPSVVWTSSAPAAVSVSSSGVVTALAPGSALITAAAADGGCSASCLVTVPKTETPAAKSVQITLDDCTARPGETVSLGLYIDSETEFTTLGVRDITFTGGEVRFVGFDNCTELVQQSILGTNGVDNEKGTLAFGYTVPQAFSGKVCDLRVTVPETAQDGVVTVSLTAIVQNGSTSLPLTLHSGIVHIRSYAPGDLNWDDSVDVYDAALLLQHSLFPDLYPLSYPGRTDLNRDGSVDVYDAALLLQYSLFPDLYPIE